VQCAHGNTANAMHCGKMLNQKGEMADITRTGIIRWMQVKLKSKGQFYKRRRGINNEIVEPKWGIIEWSFLEAPFSSDGILA
jgi:hypothetical protein